MEISKKQKYLFSIELYSNNKCTQFQANIVIFGSAVAQKPGKVEDVTILKAIFDIFNCRTSKQMTFLESGDKIGQDRQILKSFDI